MPFSVIQRHLEAIRKNPPTDSGARQGRFPGSHSTLIAGGVGQLDRIEARDVLRCGIFTFSDHTVAAAGTGAWTAAGTNSNKGERHCKQSCSSLLTCYVGGEGGLKVAVSSHGHSAPSSDLLAATVLPINTFSATPATFELQLSWAQKTASPEDEGC